MKRLFLVWKVLMMIVVAWAQGDQSNGTYKNPVIFADFPDPDVIRVGDTYYMISTTMVNFPGATIVKSKDLVNWGYLTLCSPKRV